MPNMQGAVSRKCLLEYIYNLNDVSEFLTIFQGPQPTGITSKFGLEPLAGLSYETLCFQCIPKSNKKNNLELLVLEF